MRHAVAVEATSPNNSGLVLEDPQIGDRRPPSAMATARLRSTSRVACPRRRFSWAPWRSKDPASGRDRRRCRRADGRRYGRRRPCRGGTVTLGRAGVTLHLGSALLVGIADVSQRQFPLPQGLSRNAECHGGFPESSGLSTAPRPFDVGPSAPGPRTRSLSSSR